MLINKFVQQFCITSAAALLLTACSDNNQSDVNNAPATNPGLNNNQASNAQAQESVSERFNELLNNYYEDSLRLNPIQATFEGDSRYNDRFVNYLSDDFEEQYKANITKYKSALSGFNEADLNDNEKISKAALQWELEIAEQGLKFNSDLTPIDQMWSINLMMGQLASGAGAQPFKTVEDYNNWLKRVDEYLIWLASAQDKMQQGIEKKYVLPKSLIKKVLPQLEAMTVTDVEKNLFFSPVKNFPDSFSQEQKQQLTLAYTSMVSDKVVPAYTKIHNFMSTDYLAAGRDSSGIDALAGGSDFYQHNIKLHTTTNMTADEIHQLGLSEVARISAEMEKVKQEVGFEGELKDFFNYVRSNKDLMPFTDPQEVLDYYASIYERMKPQIDKLFDMKPKSAFEIRRTEKFREKSASAEYNPGSIDGTRPGIFYMPIPDISTYNLYDNESLFLHEAIPGHHYQTSLTQENNELPKFRKTLWYSGYGEGWALYSESLGKELGLYTDPYQYFGALSAEMHRAIRLVVDTGIHSKGWTREQAIEYSLSNEAEAADSVVREIERYMANPGQALSYKIGQLKILELRALAQKELGDKFNIGQFHNQVLETGCVPLAVLESKIRRWITKTK